MERFLLNKDTYDLLEDKYLFKTNSRFGEFNGGAEAKLFINPNNDMQLLKIYRDFIPSIKEGKEVDDYNHDLRYRFLNQSRKINHELLLPIGYVDYKDVAVGPIIEYLKGYQDFITYLTCNVDAFYEMFGMLNEIIEKYNRKYFYLCDLGSGNVLVGDNKKIRIIDCDFNGLIIRNYEDLNLKELVYYNYKLLVKDFFDYLFCGIPIELREMIDDTKDNYKSINRMLNSLERIRKS